VKLRALCAIVACLVITSCKVRDFGCLANGYWVAAPSHAEMGIQDVTGNTVLERYVSQIGLAKGYIVAICRVRSGDDTVPLPDEKPCHGFNVIDTETTHVWRDMTEAQAEEVLFKAGLKMPELHYANTWFNQDWPDGKPSDFCRATFHENPAPQD